MKGMICMRKKILTCILVVALLAAISSVVAVAAQGISNAMVDENGKVVDIEKHVENVSREPEKIKKQIIEEEEQLKSNPSTVIINSRANSDEDFAELREKAEAAEKNADYLRELFENGIKIVNRYSDTKLDENVDNLQEIDRDMIEAIVIVLEDNLLTQNDADILKECIAQKYFIVLSTDPIYQRINTILGIEP